MTNDIVNLYAGYTVFWAGLLGYFMYLLAKQRKMEKDLKRIEKIINLRQEIGNDAADARQTSVQNEQKRHRNADQSAADEGGHGCEVLHRDSPD